jgi:ribosomal protein L7/L12
VGDSGSFTVGAALIGAVCAFALFGAWATAGPEVKKTVSLRPANVPTPKVERPGQRRALRPGELTRIRDQERIVREIPVVAVRLAETGRNQIAVIKVLRNYLDIGLKEAKQFSDEAKKGRSPLVIASMAVEHAQQLARDIEAAGGAVEFEEPVIR